MTARILVVDDILANVKLLEAKLTAEYFSVITAMNGPDAIEIAGKELPDIILLDVMMPGMDGFEVCRRLKADSETMHIPVIMVTALDQPSDKIHGLEAGADDFLTKPVDDIALFARIKSLVRLKQALDEMRMRENTSERMGLIDDGEDKAQDHEPEGNRILLVETNKAAAERIVDTLAGKHQLQVESDPKKVLNIASCERYDLAIINLNLGDHDGLRLCSQLRSLEQSRNLPVLVIVDPGNSGKLMRALDIGINDYLMNPLDRNELLARVRTQLKRKRYIDKLRDNVQHSLEMAIIDPLTGLNNRRYMTQHLETLIQKGISRGTSISFLILDIDHFKLINDSHGHDAGDAVLKQFAKRLSNVIRGIDMACRYGGEEFVIVMPDTDITFATVVAERLRQQISDEPFDIPGRGKSVDVTVSVGISALEGDADNTASIFKRADEALYQAKRSGRNRVVYEAA